LDVAGFLSLFLFAFFLTTTHPPHQDDIVNAIKQDVQQTNGEVPITIQQANTKEAVTEDGKESLPGQVKARLQHLTEELQHKAEQAANASSQVGSRLVDHPTEHLENDDKDLYGCLEIAEHIRRNYEQDVHGKRRTYNKFYIAFGLELFLCLGRSRYNKMRNLQLLPLPSCTTLQQYMPKLRLATDSVCDTAFDKLVDAIECTQEYQQASDAEKSSFFFGHASFDGAGLSKKSVEMSKHTMTIVNVGGTEVDLTQPVINQVYEEAYLITFRTQRLSSAVRTVLAVVGVVNNNGKEIADAVTPLLADLQGRLKARGGGLRFVVCDGTDCNNDTLNRVKSELGIPSLRDFPHLLKCVRNSVVSFHQRGMKTPYGELSMGPLMSVHGSSYNVLGHLLPKRVVKPDNFEKMNVDSAVRLLCNSEVRYLVSQVGHDHTKGLVAFLELMQRIWLVVGDRTTHTKEEWEHSYRKEAVAIITELNKYRQHYLDQKAEHAEMKKQREAELRRARAAHRKKTAATAEPLSKNKAPQATETELIAAGYKITKKNHSQVDPFQDVSAFH